MDINLPDFVFWDGNCHLGDTLDSRTFIQHLPTYSIIECVYISAKDDMDFEDYDNIHHFIFKNSNDYEENCVLILHYTLAEENEIKTIFENTSKWLMDYFAWEDQNLLNRFSSN